MREPADQSLHVEIRRQALKSTAGNSNCSKLSHPTYSGHHMLIALLSVRKSAIFTALDSAGKIDKISPAFVAESVKRTVAEKAIE